jgi:hypothetical protein
MAGPACSVLHPNLVNPESVLREFVELIGCAPGSTDFNVHDTHGIGGIYRGEDRPFVLYSERRDPAEDEQIVQKTGWVPAPEFGLAAMCNQDDDHRILAEMALWLARRLSGHINVGGTLDLPAHLAPHAFSVTYETGSAWESQYMVLDPLALAGWLEFPHFRMVK